MKTFPSGQVKIISTITLRITTGSLRANKNFMADKNKSGLDFRTNPPATQLPTRNVPPDKGKYIVPCHPGDSEPEYSDCEEPDNSHFPTPRRSQRLVDQQNKQQTVTKGGATISHKCNALLAMIESSIKRIVKSKHNFTKEQLRTCAAHLLTTTALS